MSFLKEIRYGQLLCIGMGLVLTGIFAAKLFRISYLTNLGWAAHFLLFALCPRLPYRSRINPGETMWIRFIAILATLYFLFVF